MMYKKTKNFTNIITDDVGTAESNADTNTTAAERSESQTATADEDQESEEIDSTVLDTTTITSSRLKRAGNSRTRLASAPAMSDLTDNNTEDR